MKALATTTKSSVAHTPDDPRCKAIEGRYGSVTEMIARWAPAKLFNIARNVEQSAEVPSLTMMIRTYSQGAMETLLQAYIASSIARAGIADKFAPSDYEQIARMICDSEKLRTLNMAYLLTFFAKLCDGEVELYGYTPNSFMRAMQTYYKEAKQKQEDTLLRTEKARKEKEREEHQRTAVTFEQFCKETGRDPSDNPFENLLKQS